MNKHPWSGRLLACAGGLALLGLALPAPAAAQLAPIGPTVEIASFFVRGVDVAADPSGGYLVVGAQNAVVGVCVNAQGQPTTGSIVIKPTSAGNVLFGAYPRARYSPQANAGRGAYLVVWPQEELSTVRLHSRMVSCTEGLIGSEQVISDNASAWLESGAAVAYSHTSQHFFVVWKSFPPNIAVKGRIIDNNGTGVGDIVTLSSGFGRDPGIAWNSATNEFGVSFSGETATTAYSAFVRVPSNNPAAFARTTFNVIGGGMTTITDVDFNPNTNGFVMTWFEFPGPHTRIAEFDSAGNLIAQRVGSSSIGSYDALGLAFNNMSKTFLVGGVDRVNDDVFTFELDGRGNPLAAPVKVSTSARPARYTRVASSANHNSWNLAFNVRNFSAMANQVVQTGTVGPGDGPITPPPPPPPPPTGTPAPRLYIDSPAYGARVSGDGFPILGWAIDTGSSAGTGVDMVHIWAHPTSGATAIFVGSAPYGTSRGDVGAAFGSARFTPSGFAIGTRLPPGTYDVAVYPHSTVADAFTAASVVRITVEAPTSVPRMWVDTPQMNDNLSQNIRVGGWAIDLGASATSGVDAIHVWAYPTNGGPAIMLGAGTYGHPRPDVGGAFGNARYSNSGFNVEGTLPRGDYNLVVYAHSSVVQAFNNVFVIPVRVN
jgi:hypothetical protein